MILCVHGTLMKVPFRNSMGAAATVLAITTYCSSTSERLTIQLYALDSSHVMTVNMDIRCRTKQVKMTKSLQPGLLDRLQVCSSRRA